MTSSPRKARTRALLGCGVAAGPVYIGVGLAQILTRDGLIAASFVLARRFAQLGRQHWTRYSVITGVGFFWRSARSR